MSLRSSRIVRKYAPFYTRMRGGEESDSDGGVRSTNARSSSASASFTWLHRAFSSGFTHSHYRVPLSESPKRELRMRSATKVRRHQQQAKRQKKHFPRLWW